jgi:hypothetical protein
MAAHTHHHRQLTCLDLTDPFGWGRRRAVDRGVSSDVGVGSRGQTVSDADALQWPPRAVPPGRR